ncbi:DUF4123 domain-containing protein [Marinobacter fonticola]|uniref:DUF4123 domain-containing protein n=1 Tax=Marinobacter fonticola TaxID=2603215 RepID=UPI0011E7147C|nr:DUF4123 domain-containing protein [Marinobacter fonticola]
MSEQPSLRQRLEQAASELPETPDIYLVLSGTSDSEPVRHFFDRDGLSAQPLYRGTPYAGWQDVMPYLVAVSPDSRFLDWIDETSSTDWGWAALSMASMEQVFTHLRSLTQIALSNGKAVFFRHWDARFLGPIYDHLESGQQARLMGPIESWIAPDQIQRRNPGPVIDAEEKPYPWFTLPKSVEDALATLCWDQLIDSTVAALHQLEPSPIAAYPAPVARQKVQRHLRRLVGQTPVTEIDTATFNTLHHRLQQDAGRSIRGKDHP